MSNDPPIPLSLIEKLQRVVRLIDSCREADSLIAVIEARNGLCDLIASVPHMVPRAGEYIPLDKQLMWMAFQAAWKPEREFSEGDRLEAVRLLQDGYAGRSTAGLPEWNHKMQSALSALLERFEIRRKA